MTRFWKRRPRYSDHIDYLLASIVYLGTNHEFLSRTPSKLANELSLDQARLIATFTAFPGIFRKSLGKGETGEHPYSLQARYALRIKEESGEEDYPALPPETLRLLYDFVQKSADEERTSFRTNLTLALSTLAALLSAAAAIYVASAKLPEATPRTVLVQPRLTRVRTVQDERPVRRIGSYVAPEGGGGSEVVSVSSIQSLNGHRAR
jgi:hypothetical protein